MSKRVLATMLIVAMNLTLFSITAQAGALNGNNSLRIVTNEYDYVELIETADEKKLGQMGLTTETAEKMVTQFYEELNSRSLMSDEELYAKGYTGERIELLRAYAAGAVLTDAEMRAITGSCEGEIISYYCYATRAKFKYAWSWDQEPLIMLDDAAGMAWRAVNDEAEEIAVTASSVSSQIKYYYGNVVKHTDTGDEEPGLEFSGVSIQFPMTYGFFTATNDYEHAYAKEGYVTVIVNLENTVSAEINYVEVLGVYGHTIIGIGSPTLSLGGGFSASFTGNTQVDNIGAAHEIITR